MCKPHAKKICECAQSFEVEITPISQMRKQTQKPFEVPLLSMTSRVPGVQTHTSIWNLKKKKKGYEEPRGRTGIKPHLSLTLLLGNLAQDSVVSHFIYITTPWTIISILIEMETETP